MKAICFLCGMLGGMFFVLVGIWLSIQIDEHKKQKQYEIYHDRFIQAQCDWILEHQPSDEEIKKMFSELPEAKGDDYCKMFENCEGNVKGGEK